MEDILLNACKKLRFSSNIVENAKLIQKDSILDFLLELFTLELQYRKVKRINSLIKAAKFDVLKTFEDYSFNDIKFPKSITPQDVLDTNFIDKKENLILYGNVGS